MPLTSDRDSIPNFATIPIPWMFRQIDLETGADIKVGHYDDIPVGGSSGGIEVRVTKCEPEQEGEFVYDKLHYVTFYLD